MDRKIWLPALLVALFCIESIGVPNAKKRAFEKKKVYETLITIPVQPAREALTGTVRGKNRNQINTMLGIHVVKGSALFTGVQYGRRISDGARAYLGLEYNFSLYSPGSILGFMAGGWYEFTLERARGPAIAAGIVAGAGFTTDVIATPTTVFLGFLDLAFSQPMDDLFDLRIQLRPGVMHRYIAFMMNLSIAFRL